MIYHNTTIYDKNDSLETKGMEVSVREVLGSPIGDIIEINASFWFGDLNGKNKVYLTKYDILKIAEAIQKAANE